MNHFLEISRFSEQTLLTLIHRALELKHSKHYPTFHDHIMAQLFYENSTRTRVSFKLAARKLGMEVVNIIPSQSSERKGESIEDTLQTLTAMGIQVFVIRHKQDGLPTALSLQAKDSVHIINAGDGRHAHPTQALLDMMTIIEEKKELKNLKIAIVGDVRHSRVANSLQVICERLKIGQVMLVSPKLWQPSKLYYGEMTDSLSAGLKDADVIICLRVQRERLVAGEHLDLDHYHHAFAITGERLTLAKPDVMVMHPGPVNRGVEINSEVVDGPHSFILKQVENGVYARMAILEAMLQQTLTAV